MTIKAKYSVVVKNGRVEPETKAFRKKQQALMYAATLEGNWTVVSLEAILD